MYIPIGSMYAIYGNIYHQYTPNVSIDTIHGSYGLYALIHVFVSNFISVDTMDQGHASVEVIANASASLVSGPQSLRIVSARGTGCR